MLMKVLIVSTSDISGGAALASFRLMKALQTNGEKAKMLVVNKLSDDISVCQYSPHWWARWKFLLERLRVFVALRLKKGNLFALDCASFGVDITKTKEFREADIVHLNWVNQGFLSLKGVRKMVLSGKPVVWTMHDAWLSTGVCHVALSCPNYKTECKGCPYLGGITGKSDLSTKVFNRKKRLFEGSPIEVVTCSDWLRREAMSSRIFTKRRITAIPNVLDSHVFRPLPDKEALRRELGLPLDKRLVLFVAQTADNPMKGMDYLYKALQLLENERDDIALVVIGSWKAEGRPTLRSLSINLGYIVDPCKMAKIYNAADVFVLPSLSENLPNTIMEAMGCALPVVAFQVGGIPEMISHRQTGYLAQYRSAEDLKEGIVYCLDESRREALSRAALHRALTLYSPQSVAMKYVEVYHQARAHRHYLK